MKTLIRLSFFLFLFQLVLSCSNPRVCVRKYDDEGCGICDLKEGLWVCEKKVCEVKRPDLAGKCIKTLSDGNPFRDNLKPGFDEYVARARDHIEKYRDFINDENKEIELKLNTPFERKISCYKSSRRKKGILLIHGLTDSPGKWDDLASTFAANCFLVRAILLDGHGTHPFDLGKVNYQDWLKSAEFRYKELESEVDEVYLGGFSLGGALSTLLALRNPGLDGLYLFAPAIEFHPHIQRGVDILPFYTFVFDFARAGVEINPASYTATHVQSFTEVLDIRDDIEKHLKPKT